MLQESKDTVDELLIQLCQNTNVLIHLIKKTQNNSKIQNALISQLGITINMDESLEKMLSKEGIWETQQPLHYSENSRESEYVVLRQEISDICAKCTEAREERDTAIRQLEECKGVSGKKFHYIISIFSTERLGSDLLKISLDSPVSTSESLEKYLQAYHNFNPHRAHFEVMLLSDIQDVSPEVTFAKEGWFK